MLTINKEQENLLLKYIPNYKDFDDIGDLFSELNDVMLDSLDENDEATDATTTISRLYDEIYAQNQ